MTKKIIVTHCFECPYSGKCSAWKKLSKKDRFALTVGVGTGKFILKDCELDDNDFCDSTAEGN